MLLFYIRHGDPIYDPDQLTPLGKRQAEAVARRLALFGIDEVYSSPSNRAIETAMPTCEILGKKPVTLDFLNENNLSALKLPSQISPTDWIWSHPEYSQILAGQDVRDLGNRWYEHPSLEKYHFEKIILPINEKLDEFLASHGYQHDLQKGLYKVTERHAEKRVAIFAHECMGKIVMSHLLDIPFPSYAIHFEMHTSAFSVVRFDDGVFYDRTKNDPPCPYARARLLTLSNDSHLYRDGLPLAHRFTHIREPY